MRAVGVRGWGIALLVGLAAAGGARAQDGPSNTGAPAQGSSWFSRWFGSSKRTEKKIVPRQDKESEARTAAANKGPTVVEAAAVQRKREEAALMRRLEVCDRLRAIAEQTNDDELRRRADQLDEQANAAYIQRTAHLPGAGMDYDGPSLERNLTSGAAGGRALMEPTSASRGVPVGQRAAAGRDDQ
jgi:hypothetical protein